VSFLNVQGLPRDGNDKRLRVEFIDGVSEGTFVVMLSNSPCQERCDGVVYTVLCSNRPGRTKTGDTDWAEMNYLKSFTPIGDLN
jgi:hypothetical protein